MAKRKSGKPKALTYELIDRESDTGRPLYALLESLIDAHHEDLHDARIALAWCTSWKPDVDGRVTLGKCVKASDLHRELAPYDFVILLGRDFFEDPLVTSQQARALIYHELMHAAVKYDARGEPDVDARGRTKYRIRKHDLEEFSAIAARYGCWKKDIEDFYGAVNSARLKSPDYWIGVNRLHVMLQAVGCTVPTEVIGSWTQAERREAEEWAVLREELDRLSKPDLLGASVEPPAHVVAAGAPQETAAS
jgi:hypothetical protein